MMAEKRRSDLIHTVSMAGDRYGYGPDGLLALMEESKCASTQDVTDSQLEDFCEHHGLNKQKTMHDRIGE